MTVFQSLLNNTFLVQRRRRTSNGQGGWEIDYVDVGTVEGRIRPATSAEREQAMLEQRLITHVLYVEAGEDIVRGDQVTVSDLVVEVDAIREPSKAGEHYEIDCNERQFEQSAEDGS